MLLLLLSLLDIVLKSNDQYWQIIACMCGMRNCLIVVQLPFFFFSFSNLNYNLCWIPTPILPRAWKRVAKETLCTTDPTGHHAGLSDNLWLFIYPSYRQKIKYDILMIKSVKIWLEHAVSGLEECFQVKDWNIIAKYTSRTKNITRYYHIIDYICFCLDNIMTLK